MMDAPQEKWKVDTAVITRHLTEKKSQGILNDTQSGKSRQTNF
jgi:hypothetical protein